MKLSNDTKAVKTPLHPIVISSGLVSFLTDFSSQMVGPLLPLFLTTVLGAPVWVFGLMEGVAAGEAGILKVFAGWLSDRLGHRKWLMFTGYTLSNLAKPVFALTGGWGAVFAIRLLDRVGKGVRTAPRDALLADVSTASARGRTFGFRRSMDALGAALGPLAATGVLFWYHDRFRLVFALTLIPGLAALPLLLRIREMRPSGTRARSRPQLGLGHLPPRFRRFTLTASVLALATFSQGFLVLRAHALGMPEVWIPLVYFLMNVVASALSMPSGRLADRFGPRYVLLVGSGVLVIAYIGFAAASTAVWMWPLMAVYGVFVALVEGNQKAYASQLLPQTERGTGLGTFATILGIAELMASLGTGVLWQVSGPRLPFFVGAVVAAIAWLTLWRAPSSSRINEQGKA